MNMKKIIDERVEEVFLVFTMVVMLLLIFCQSVFRYIGISISWSAEIAIYLHIWQVWIGASFAIRKGEHISLDFLQKLLPSRMTFYLNMIALAIWFSFAIFLASEGTQFVLKILGTGQHSPSAQIPMWIPYVVVPLSGLLMVTRLIQRVYSLYHTEFKKDLKTT